MPQTPHPTIPLVDHDLLNAYVDAGGIERTDKNMLDAYKHLVNLREHRIHKEFVEPIQYGWEPPIWRVCDAILGLDWAIHPDHGPDYGAKMRGLLGFGEPKNVLLINGGNRAGKSEYMAKRAMQCLNKFDATVLWAFHTDTDMSIQYQQPLFWRYMPSKWRLGKPIQTQIAYIAYKAKTGFSDGSFILPNRSLCDFRNYAQDKQKIEGGELGTTLAGAKCLGFVADELIPEDWVETLVLRLSTRGASGIIGFTPVNGYTGTVKAFLDGSKTVRNSAAYLLPKDGKDPDGRVLEVEDCDGWIRKINVNDVVEGREFEQTPRVVKCADKRRAAVFFHSSDNPYGNPREVMANLMSKDSRFKRERWYGVADKLVAGKFPMFNNNVHVIKHDRIPVGGTDYMLVDPCDGRNFFMLWVKVVGPTVYVTREWPSQVDMIPGIGVLGEWALPTGDTRQLDGRRGPAQNSLGWGLLQYKREIARIEGWEQYDPDASDESVRSWAQYPGDVPADARLSAATSGRIRQKVFARYLDARYGNTQSLDASGVRTLFEEFDSVGLTFRETTSEVRATIYEGVQLINAALYYNPERPVVDVINCPRLFVSDACINTIFAMQTWTGLDGNKGATKDPIDLLRYVYLKGLEQVDMSEEYAASMAGMGCY